MQARTYLGALLTCISQYNYRLQPKFKSHWPWKPITFTEKEIRTEVLAALRWRGGQWGNDLTEGPTTAITSSAWGCLTQKYTDSRRRSSKWALSSEGDGLGERRMYPSSLEGEKLAAHDHSNHRSEDTGSWCQQFAGDTSSPWQRTHELKEIA